MYSVTDDDETLTFETLDQLKQYLVEACTIEYAMDVIEWATSDKPTLAILNNKETDKWSKGWGVTETGTGWPNHATND